MERIFNDKTKFKVVNNDPTFRNLASVQNYLNTLVSRGELTENDKMEMKPKSARLGRAHGLPKIHKDYTNIPNFRPILDTSCTVYYGVGKYLSNRLNPLTLNAYSLKDSFEATQRIHSIPIELFAQGYRYVSFDVVSLFTNVPLKKTIETILKRVYNDQLVQTKLEKRTLKKLLLDAYQKTAFFFNGKIYKQTDGVSMGSSLGPVLANIIMIQMESEIVKPLESKGVIKHYMRYVDDTLVLIKPENIETVLRKFNSFHNNLHFTVDSFDGRDIHFLDPKIEGIETDVYDKPTHTGQYFDFTSQSPWNLKTASVKALVNRAKKICSTLQNFNRQLHKIKKFMAWNNYPIYIVKASLKRQLKGKPEKQTKPHDLIKIYLKVPYLGKQGEQLVTMLVRKLPRYLKPNVKLIKFFNTKKASIFCPTKDKVTKKQKVNVIYKIICRGCNNVYVGKTDRCFGIRMNEHGTRSDQPMHQHLTNCTAFQETVNINALPELLNDSKQIDHKAHVLNGVLNNCDIIDSNDNWSQLCFLEAFYIKKLSPSINNGLKASKELQLFC